MTDTTRPEMRRAVEPIAARCRCTHEEGDSDCAVHPRCNNCNEPLSGTELKAERDRLLAALLAANDEIERMKRELFDLRTALISVCDDAVSHYDRRSQFRAFREAANGLAEPFSFEKVQRIYAEQNKPTTIAAAGRGREG